MCLGAQVNLCAGSIAQLQMTCYEIGMKVSQEDVPDHKLLFPGILNVMINIALRVHDRSVMCAFVGDEVRSVGQASEIVLLQYHCSSRGPHCPWAWSRRISAALFYAVHRVSVTTSNVACLVSVPL